MTTQLSITLRLADASEVDELLAIGDDAAALFAEAGFVLDSPKLPVYIAAERERWLAAARRGAVELAVDQGGSTLGFRALTRWMARRTSSVVGATSPDAARRGADSAQPSRIQSSASPWYAGLPRPPAG